MHERKLRLWHETELFNDRGISISKPVAEKSKETMSSLF
uniref:Uncharacterized protein n=1 Tax=Arundo donax TaxID=35708 RepID=A0A0A9GYQ0_ARUDO